MGIAVMKQDDGSVSVSDFMDLDHGSIGVITDWASEKSRTVKNQIVMAVDINNHMYLVSISTGDYWSNPRKLGGRIKVLSPGTLLKVN